MRAHAALRYLVADESIVVARRLAEILEEMGVGVVGPAHDGREALRLFAECCPEGAFVGLDMPLLGGLEFVASVRADAQHADCVLTVLASSIEASVREACLAAGADHFVNKPAELDRVGAIVRRHRDDRAVALARREQSAHPRSSN